MLSAFGVEDPRISKADRTDRPLDPGRLTPPPLPRKVPPKPVEAPSGKKWHNNLKTSAYDRKLGPEPKPERDAYVPGSITFHDEQAKLRSRKKAAAGRRAEYGGAVATAGLTAGATAYGNSHHIARAVVPPAQFIGHKNRADELVNTARKVRRVGTIGGLGVAGVGAAMVGEGVVNRTRHARAQNRSVQAAQAARKLRAGDRNWSS